MEEWDLFPLFFSYIINLGERYETKTRLVCVGICCSFVGGSNTDYQMYPAFGNCRSYIDLDNICGVCASDAQNDSASFGDHVGLRLDADL